MEVQISLQDLAFISIGYISKSRIAGSYGGSIFDVLRTPILSSVVSVLIDIPTRVPFSLHLSFLFSNLFYILGLCIRCDLKTMIYNLLLNQNV